MAQHDLKRLLAYSSIENVGVIVLALGAALVGRATGDPILTALALTGALLHAWNHALFKSLLFFVAGSVMHATGTRRMNLLGGLGRAMPWTSAVACLGCIAIGAMRPDSACPCASDIALLPTSGSARGGERQLRLAGTSRSMPNSAPGRLQSAAG